MKARHHILVAVFLGSNLSVAQAVDPRPPAHDGRTVLRLTADERAMILEEMRQFLNGIQKMTAGLGDQDMQATADAARNMGQKMMREVPPALRAKLPQDFRQLGATVHGSFDQIALDAETLQDVSYTLNQLSGTLKNCVSCHALYQIQVSVINDRH